MSTRVPPTAQIGAMLEALWDGDAQLQTLAPGGMHPDLVPQGKRLPAMVYVLGDQQPLKALRSATVGWVVDFLVVAIDEGLSKALDNARRGGERLVALLDQQQPPIEGWRVVKLMLVRAISQSSDENGKLYRRAGGQFRLWVEPS